MGGEGIAAARGWEGTSARAQRSGMPPPLESGAAIGKGSARGAAVLAGLTAGQEVQALGREAGLGAARRWHRCGHFIDLNRAQGLGSRDFGGGADGEVEFHC